MSNYDELIGILKELLFNRFLPEPKIIKGLLGDGTGVVRVPERKDFNYARFNRGSTESFEVFNKTVPEVNDWPILISELPWQPGLTQVVGTDWESYIQSGWGDSVSTSNPHAPTHIWRDGYIGSDPLDIYMRAIAPGRAYSSSSTGSVVFVNSFEYHTGTIWPGVPGVDLSPLMSSIPTGTARFAGVYVNPVSNSLGVVTGNTSVDTQAFDPPLVTFPFGTIPIARVRLYGGQGGLLENDFRDARRLFDVPPTGTASANGEGWKLGNTVVVSSSGEADYTSIQDAINAASSGDLIWIDRGFYTETLTINKRLTLVGADNDNTIIYSSDTTTIDVTAVRVTIKSLRVENDNAGASKECIKCNSNQLVLENVVLDSQAGTTAIGVHLTGGTLSKIQDCRINVNNATNKYGVLADTGTVTLTILQGEINSNSGTDVVTNHANVTINLSMVTMVSFAETLGSIMGSFINSNSGAIHLIGSNDYIDQEEISTPANPAAGRWRIYPKGDGYYQLDDAGNETALFGGGDLAYTVCNGRLTLSSATPVITSDVTAATTIYFTPYAGNLIGLYDGADWQVIAYTEKSVAVPSTVYRVFDIFGYLSSGDLALETLDWSQNTATVSGATNATPIQITTSAAHGLSSGDLVAISGVGGNTAANGIWSITNVGATTFDLEGSTGSGAYTSGGTVYQVNNGRATGLTLQDGVYVKDGDATRRYLGTGMTTGTSGQTEHSILNRLLWNYYNRRLQSVALADLTSHTYTSATTRVYRNQNSNKVAFVLGVIEDTIITKLEAEYNFDSGDGAIVTGLSQNRTGAIAGAVTRIADVGDIRYLSDMGFFTFNTGYNFLQLIQQGAATSPDFVRGIARGGLLC